MITKGIIKSKLNENKYLISIPVFTSSGSNSMEKEYEATCCSDNGSYESYLAGDCVFVGFEDNLLGKPIILGSLYLGLKNAKARSYKYLSDLAVENTAKLPKGTTIDGVDVLKSIVDLKTSGGGYTLPIASSTTLGGIKVGQNLTIDESGVLSASGGGTYDYTQLDNKPQINSVTLSGNLSGTDLGLVQAESGKGLSTNDFTNAYKDKLDGIESGAEVNVQSNWNESDTTSDSYVQNKPTINSHQLSGDMTGSDLGLVDSEAGKSLSTNDFTNAYKDKLDGIESGAEVNVQSNWTESDSSSDAFILNKPTIDDTLNISSTNAIQNKAVAVLVPNQASSSNQLADKAFVNSSIENVAAYYITDRYGTSPNYTYEAFKTKALLNASTVVYSGGVERIPTKNDYCVVTADESRGTAVSGYSSFTTTSQYVGYYVIYNNAKTLVTADNKDSVGITAGTTVAYVDIPTTRYLYGVTQSSYSSANWEFQYIVNNSGLTATQLEALNSGVTRDNWVDKATDQTITGTKTFTKINARSLYFQNAGSSTVTYPSTGFYQWNDEWQVNARNPDGTFSHNLFVVNNSTKNATLFGHLYNSTSGKNIGSSSVRWGTVYATTFDGTATDSNNLIVNDTRDTTPLPSSFTAPGKRVSSFFTNSDKPTSVSDWFSGVTVAGLGGNYAVWQIGSQASVTAQQRLYFRSGVSSTWNSWLTIADLESAQTVTGIKTFSTTNGFNYSGMQGAVDNVYRNVWFSNSTKRGVPVYSNSLMFNPSTRTLRVGESSAGTITSGSTLCFSSASGTSMIFQKGGTEVGRFNTSGNLIVGNISSPASITEKLYVDGTAKATTFVGNLGEAYLTWGGKSVSGGVTVADTCMYNEFNANRLAYMQASDILVEYSTDGGTTWTASTTTDNNKRSLVTLSQTFYTGGTSSSASTTCRLRVTLTASQGKLYFTLKKILIHLSTNGVSNAKCLVEYATIGSPDTFTTADTYNVSGWSGWNSIPFATTFGGSSSQTSQTRKIRMTFYYTGKSASYPNAQLFVDKIRMFGGTSYNVADSYLPLTGKMYTYDINKNVTFPADIYCVNVHESSDERLKENITEPNIDYQSVIESIKLKEFNFKSDERKIPTIGVIAQELKEILPDKYKNSIVDECGSSDDEQERYLSISTGKLLYITIGALKDEIKKREEVEKRLNKIEELLGI